MARAPFCMLEAFFKELKLLQLVRHLSVRSRVRAVQLKEAKLLWLRAALGTLTTRCSEQQN